MTFRYFMSIHFCEITHQIAVSSEICIVMPCTPISLHHGEVKCAPCPEHLLYERDGLLGYVPVRRGGRGGMLWQMLFVPVAINSLFPACTAHSDATIYRAPALGHHKCEYTNIFSGFG